MVMKGFCKGLIVVGLACQLSLSAYAASESSSGDNAIVLTVGVVPQFDQPRIQAVWSPLLGEIENRTGIKFVLRGAATIPAFERDLVQGEYDLAYINPYHVVKLSEAPGYQPLVRDVGQDLYGILVVPRSSPIKSVDELNGQIVAFPAPLALGAALLMRAELHDRYRVEVVPHYVFSHSSVYLNVALEEAVAGGGVQKTLSRQPQELQDRLRVLYKTNSVPSHPIAVHRRVPAHVRQQLLSVMLGLGRDAIGRELLSAVPIARVGVADVKDYQFLTEMGLGRFQ